MSWTAILAIVTGALVPASAAANRSHAVTAEFQRAHPCPSTGLPGGSCPGWRKDHIIALACGGADSPANMQWQTIAEAREKNRWERKGCR